MDFKIGEHIVFTDEFKEVSGKYLKYPNHLNAVFIIADIMSLHYVVSLDGINKIGGYQKVNFRLATENEIKRNMIKRIFIS